MYTYGTISQKGNICRNMIKVDNAIIMAAGMSNRFAPLSYERHKALVEVKGDVLIERQIEQLLSAGIKEIILVTGYKQEQLSYLKEKYGVKLVHNPEYLTRNNHSSIYYARDYLHNSYVCSSDNYFSINPFKDEVEDSYYASIYREGNTPEWCITTNEEDIITDVKVGGKDSWIMLGHTFWDETFSKKYIEILEKEYDLPQTIDKLWESIYLDHINELKMKIHRYHEDDIYEFDSLDELREFDTSYWKDTRSSILKEIAKGFHTTEEQLTNIKAYFEDSNEASGFTFIYDGESYLYLYNEKRIKKV